MNTLLILFVGAAAFLVTKVLVQRLYGDSIGVYHIAIYNCLLVSFLAALLIQPLSYRQPSADGAANHSGCDDDFSQPVWLRLEHQIVNFYDKTKLGQEFTGEVKYLVICGLDRGALDALHKKIPMTLEIQFSGSLAKSD